MCGIGWGCMEGGKKWVYLCIHCCDMFRCDIVLLQLLSASLISFGYRIKSLYPESSHWANYRIIFVASISAIQTKSRE